MRNLLSTVLASAFVLGLSTPAHAEINEAPLVLGAVEVAPIALGATSLVTWPTNVTWTRS